MNSEADAMTPVQEKMAELREDFGRIETADGRLIYFHRRSVLGKSFAALAVGDAVRFVEEPGDRGPQASTVHVVT